jgi:hypothetical protein
MDPFRTIVDIEPSAKKITYQSAILLLGSCFSDTIGERLVSCKFNMLINPFGVLFNPASISENIRRLIENKAFTAEQLYFYNNQWVSFNHYTGYSNSDKDICLERINDNISTASSFLQKADFLFLTFGTAWVYKFNETGKIVANCHKIPASAFTRFILEPGEIIANYVSLLQELKTFNPGLSVVFSLSPVRHVNDGAVNNQKSKSILHYSIDKILELIPGTIYFPAYEIFMDELRDYRFYAGDMLHPSDPGIEYIWKRFMDTFVTSDISSLMKEVNSIIKAVNHRPVNPEDPAYLKFLQSTITTITHLIKTHPYLDFRPEIEELTKRLKEAGK